MIEQWRSIPGFPLYEASSEGRIRRRAGTPRAPQARVLRPRIRPTRPGKLPYRDVALSAEGKVQSQTVHKLVCLAFHGEPPSPEHEVAHGDGDPGNNRPGNLRWATSIENKADAKVYGRAA